MSDSEKLVRIFAFLLSIPMHIGCWIWSGYCCAMAWGWIVVPAFGLPAISSAQAMALGVIVAFFTWTIPRRSDLRDQSKQPEDAMQRLGTSLIEHAFYPTALFGVAWVIKGFM